MGNSVVLVVEDDPDIADLLQIALRGIPGVQTLLAKSGEAALRLAREARPALMLLDLIIPEVSGLDVVRIIRGDPATSHIRAIAVTGWIESREDALRAGCVEFIEKPFDIDDLVTTVAKYLAA